MVINMKKMKRLLALLLVFIMLLGSFASCGNKDGNVEESESEEIAEPLLASNISRYVIIVPEGGASE